MNSLAQTYINSTTQPLVIGDLFIRQDEDGRYCLNDLHKASGDTRKDRPSYFLENEKTQELIKTIDDENYDVGNPSSFKRAVNIIRGRGKEQGTYAVKELVYSYAMWISAKFHLTVIRAYDAMVMQWQINDRKSISPEQQSLLHEIVDRRSNGERKIYAEMWSRHNRHFKIAKYSQLLSVHFSEAVHYLETMDIKSSKKLDIQTDLTVFERLSTEVVNQVTDYIWSLNREIRRLKGVAPALPSFDEKTMAQAVINQQMQGKRMFLTFNPVSSAPEISLVEDDLLMVRRNEIENLLNDPDKVPQDRIPNIIQSAAKRLK
ncbi:KilA-N domain-containing protein [Acinetobacter pollinis]|uniref:KilA-N domain-containing protein n=1 Tax=Acinetobacter pollinis TaxID=2605270 RepID=UPI0018C3314B|nr:KilA-N domain-containing protein [Acinetobacter pollinis]MBF7694232.1 KilA-N domain-containing protein [Acinetobacter pollinis]MBF7701787.1 KilA-N domain-containing protein [Acinetobacter pollinis]